MKYCYLHNQYVAFFYFDALEVNVAYVVEVARERLDQNLINMEDYFAIPLQMEKTLREQIYLKIYLLVNLSSISTHLVTVLNPFIQGSNGYIIQLHLWIWELCEDAYSISSMDIL